MKKYRVIVSYEGAVVVSVDADNEEDA